MYITYYIIIFIFCNTYTLYIIQRYSTTIIISRKKMLIKVKFC